jgi:hypothetical protein
LKKPNKQQQLQATQQWVPHHPHSLCPQQQQQHLLLPPPLLLLHHLCSRYL